jgi:hypothetical protein
VAADISAGTDKRPGLTNRVSKMTRPALIYDERIAEGIMVWHDREPDPTTDRAASAVLEAFEAAQEARLPPVFCYRAGVEA